MTFSIAGKVFILGEYGVLAGLPAVVATVPPRFTLKIQEPGETFHPQSPIGKWLSRLPKSNIPSLQFFDPHQGAGGFGASTAQFALALSALSQSDLSWKEAWKAYRELMKDERLIPSGADLVAQWQGGVVYFDPTALTCSDLWNLMNWENLLVFSATGQKDRKVATHQHLELLSESSLLHPGGKFYSELSEILHFGISSIQNKDLISLGRAMDQYADALAGVQLEIPATFSDRKALRQLPGVLGVKGAGAMQADAILVLLDEKADRTSLILAAENRGLKLICNGLTREKGLSYPL